MGEITQQTRRLRLVAGTPTGDAEATAPFAECWCGVTLPAPTVCEACGWRAGRPRWRFCSARCRRTWDRLHRRLTRREVWLVNWKLERPGVRYSHAQVRLQVAELTAEVAALRRELRLDD